MELNEKMLEKAKNAKSVEELIALAKENGLDLTAEEAKTYFAKLNAKEGELSDDELDDVSGGGKCGTIYYENRPVISAFNSCELFQEPGAWDGVPNGGYCKDCRFSRSVRGDLGNPLLVCYNEKRYDN